MVMVCLHSSRNPKSEDENSETQKAGWCPKEPQHHTVVIRHRKTAQERLCFRLEIAPLSKAAKGRLSACYQNWLLSNTALDFGKNLYIAGETAQWLRALAALPEVLSSIPSNHMVAHSNLQ